MELTRSRRGGRRLGRTVLACTLAFSLIALGASCSSDDKADEAETQASVEQTAGDVLAPAGDPVDGGRLAVGIMYDTTGWNPTADRWGVATAFAGSSMIEPLATLDEKGSAQPWLATTWLPNETFTTWTVTLRQGVTFHNGEPFDANVVKANMDVVISAALTGISLGGAITGTDVVDPYTVQIHTSAPWAAFPTSFLAGPNSWQRAPAMLAAGPEGSTNPIGTGPFKFSEWDSNSLKVSKNPSYWRDGEPHLDQMEFVPIVDDLSRIDALESGDLDMLLTTSAGDATRADAGYQVVKDWDTETTLLVLNTRPTAGGEPNPLANVHARRALAHATDAKAVAALLGEDLEVPVSPYSDESPWGDPSVADSVLPYDVAAAQKEIEAYKADTGATSLTVKLLGPTETSQVAVLQAVSDQWAAAGIETEVEVIDQNEMSLQGVQGKFQVILGPIYTAPDPDQNYHFWSATTVKPDGEIGINFTGYATEQTQADLDAGRSNADVTKRGAFYTDLVNVYNEQALNIWLYFTPYSIIATNEVHGLEQATEVGFGSFQPTTWWGMVWKG